MSETYEAEQGQCGICYITGPLMEIQNHFLKNHVNDNTEASPEAKGHERTDLGPKSEDQFRWNSENVLLLIRLVEKYQKDFQTGIKKNVWIKIANQMTEVTNQNFSYDQVDSKWKGLKKTYKNVKDHNKKTGNTPKRWQFFNAMDGFMANKPEIAALATCSSVHSTVAINNVEVESTDQDSSSAQSEIQEKKIKRRESATQKRHKEKMARYDKFLELFQVSVENQIGRKIGDSDE